jgi:hypothetical protein
LEFLAFWPCPFAAILLRLRGVWEGLDNGWDKEIRMSAANQDERIGYTTPARVQAWFLKKSRDLWKNKYMTEKADAKRLENRVRDIDKSRKRWREETEQLSQRVRELESQNAALQEQLAALKKDG